MCAKRQQYGISLIELIMFIVIISIAVAGVLLVMNNVNRHSSDTLVRKQALAIAESLLEEIELQGFAGLTPNPGVMLNADRTNFDNVFNYNGYITDAGIQAMDTTAIAGLGRYNVTPAVGVAATTAVWGGIPAGNAVVITVNVTGPEGDAVTVIGYRTVP